jgi:hypothetical protein
VEGEGEDSSYEFVASRFVLFGNRETCEALHIDNKQ